MNRPLPTILPEDTAPAAGQSCRQCELSDHGTRVVWGEGNPGAPLFIVLDNPGARENKSGTPFLCSTRETMQKAAYEAGIEPGSFYVSYLLKCRPRRAYDKKTARATCIGYLWKQLKAANPLLVMCLGDVVCQSFFENPEAKVKQLRGKIHAVKEYHVITSYHPLAVRRRPVLYKYFLEDWRLVARQFM
ncbi:MAG: uracil-DNA glycosylase [Firmicutes bacterium]|nr:uracil-DNA glycosylase [Bacillota bacterium]